MVLTRRLDAAHLQTYILCFDEDHRRAGDPRSTTGEGVLAGGFRSESASSVAGSWWSLFRSASRAQLALKRTQVDRLGRESSRRIQPPAHVDRRQERLVKSAPPGGLDRVGVA